jgi:hypothetical protein
VEMLLINTVWWAGPWIRRFGLSDADGFGVEPVVAIELSPAHLHFCRLTLDTPPASAPSTPTYKRTVKGASVQ